MHRARFAHSDRASSNFYPEAAPTTNQATVAAVYDQTCPNYSKSSRMHVAVGFMPAFKYLQKNSLIVFERGHKAHGYVSAGEVSKIPTGRPANDDAAFRHRWPFDLDRSGHRPPLQFSFGV